MKRPGLSPLFFSATLFLGAVVGAVTGVCAEQTPPAEAFRARLLEMFDRDGDGRLDDEERAAAQRFVTEHGLNAELRDEIMRRFDKNGNGRIDEDERAAVQEFMRERMAGGPVVAESPASELERIVRSAVEALSDLRVRFDTDHDGRLSDQEWAAARSEIARILTGPDDETRRKEAVVAELARRRQAQEKSVKAGAVPAK